MRTAPPLSIGPLDPADQDAVRALAKAAHEADGVAPLSEQPLLRLGADDAWLTHVAVRSRSGAVVGYAQVDRGGQDASAELVVHPAHRRNGIGRVLLRTCERDASLPQFGGTAGQRGKRLRVWAHGNLEPAQAFAESAGYVVVRELLFLTKPLAPPVVEPVETTPPPPPVVEPVETTPTSTSGVVSTSSTIGVHEASTSSTTGVLRVSTSSTTGVHEVSTGSTTGGCEVSASSTTRVSGGYRVRAFVPGHDDEAWVALNARAFATHPEQGRLTVADLRDRMAEPWFDPSGFFLVEASDGGLAGYLWTKVEGTDGEIYAVGVDPAHQSHGLGTALLDVGLAYLATRAETAVLYVDADNAAAVAVYEKSGFRRAAVDVQYGRPAGATISA